MRAQISGELSFHREKPLGFCGVKRNKALSRVGGRGRAKASICVFKKLGLSKKIGEETCFFGWGCFKYVFFFGCWCFCLFSLLASQSVLGRKDGFGCTFQIPCDAHDDFHRHTNCRFTFRGEKI